MVDLDDLGVQEGAHLLIERALARVPSVVVRGSSPTLGVDLPAWARTRGHTCRPHNELSPPTALAAERSTPATAFVVERSTPSAATALVVERSTPPSMTFVVERSTSDRWVGAERAGSIASPSAHAEARWGLAARGALVEAGAPALDFPLADKRLVWADEAAKLYAQAAASQWDPATAIVWDAPITHPPEVEDAIVQIMTYLIENETAALVVPTRFLARLHPHFREVMQLLAIQAADEARHIEVFTRRARLRRDVLGVSTVGGQASLATLFDEPDFAIASFLLSVLGEGSFLSLLWFLRDHAPDACTRHVAQLAAQDEARHVAFGLAHLTRHAREEPAILDRLAAAVERRHAALAHTAGLNAEVFDALVLLAAGAWEPAAIRRGHAAVVALQKAMDDGRRQRLVRIGFAPERAAALSALHTRNFM